MRRSDRDTERSGPVDGLDRMKLRSAHFPLLPRHSLAIPALSSFGEEATSDSDELNGTS